MLIGKRGSLELTSREILILIIAVIILAAVISIAVIKLGAVKTALDFLSGQGQALSAS